jgi:eukaryotic-like serine/threonine-protein kinase
MILPVGTRIGERYRIEKPLAPNGGCASIYLGALADDPKRKVAVKLAHNDSEHKSHEDVLLQHEADLLSRWDWRHPGIVRLYPIPNPNSGEEGRMDYAQKAVDLKGMPWFMVMEYLSGGSLTEQMKEIKKFSLEWKLEMFYQLVLTVAFIHQQGYGHRDLKPDNIVFRMPVRQNQIPQPVLVDFALALPKSGEAKSIVETSYTVEYASPERVLKTMGLGYEDLPNLPLEADLWSLGVLLYEILVGRLPFKGDRSKIRTTLIQDSISDSIVEQKELPHLLALCIRSMLSREPAERPTLKEVLYFMEENFLPPRITLA